MPEWDLYLTNPLSKWFSSSLLGNLAAIATIVLAIITIFQCIPKKPKAEIVFEVENRGPEKVTIRITNVGAEPYRVEYLDLFWRSRHRLIKRMWEKNSVHIWKLDINYNYLEPGKHFNYSIKPGALTNSERVQLGDLADLLFPDCDIGLRTLRFRFVRPNGKFFSFKPDDQFLESVRKRCLSIEDEATESS